MRCLVTSLIPLYACCLTPRAFAVPLGPRLAAGNIHVTSKVEGELEKRGTTQKAGIVADFSKDLGSLGIVLGMQSSTLKGQNADRGLKQSSSVVNSTLDFLAHFNLVKGLGIGLIVQNQLGYGTDYGVADEHRFVYVMSVGPSLIGRIHLGSFDMTAGVEALVNETGRQRAISSQMITFGLCYAPGPPGAGLPASQQPRL